MADKATTNYEANYRAIRSGLIRRGTTLARWAAANGYHPGTAYKAARGKRHGRIATTIRRKLEALAR